MKDVFGLPGSLTELYANNNKLADGKFYFERLTNLVKADISGNALTYLPVPPASLTKANCTSDIKDYSITITGSSSSEVLNSDYTAFEIGVQINGDVQVRDSDVIFANDANDTENKIAVAPYEKITVAEGLAPGDYTVTVSAKTNFSDAGEPSVFTFILKQD